tara:strand:- start:126 stop:323 length:198 start_codon:yes stop_codon:yes gene_type:complete
LFQSHLPEIVEANAYDSVLEKIEDLELKSINTNKSILEYSIKKLKEELKELEKNKLSINFPLLKT